MALISACHRYGWPVAARRLAARSPTRSPRCCASTAARSRPGGRVRSLAELPRRRRRRPRPRPRRGRRDRRRPAARAGSPAPTAATGTARAPSRSTSRSRAACPGPTRPAAGPGTVHAIGSFEEIVAAERDVNRGRMPERPVRPRRPAVPRRPRALAPATSTRSGPTPTSRAATTATRPRRCSTRSNASRPGLRERIVATAVRSPAELAAYNANYVGGDIITGANTPLQIADPPAPRPRPLQHRRPRPLHLLGRDPPGRRRPRHVRLQRRAVGAPPPGPELIPHAPQAPLAGDAQLPRAWAISAIAALSASLAGLSSFSLLAPATRSASEVTKRR